MVYRLLKFVEWPAPGVGRDQVFTLCVLGRESFGGLLGGLEGRTVGQRPIRLREPQDPDAAGDCEALIFAKRGARDVSTWTEALADAPVLTIGDDAGFARHGGMIEIFRSGSKLALRINIERARRARLSISSQVLALATIVRNGI